MSRIRKIVHPGREAQRIADELERLEPRLRQLRQAHRQVKALCHNPYFKLIPLADGRPPVDKTATSRRTSRPGGRARGKPASRFGDGDLPQAIRTVLARADGWLTQLELTRAIVEGYDVREGTPIRQYLRDNLSKRLYDMTDRGELEAVGKVGTRRWRLRAGPSPDAEAVEPIFGPPANF